MSSSASARTASTSAIVLPSAVPVRAGERRKTAVDGVQRGTHRPGLRHGRRLALGILGAPARDLVSEGANTRERWAASEPQDKLCQRLVFDEAQVRRTEAARLT